MPFVPLRIGPEPNELGHPVPLSFVVGRNERAAVGLTSFIAYHNGFAFSLVMTFTDRDNRLTPLSSVSHEMLRAIKGEAAGESSETFRLTLTFADGSQIDSAPSVVRNNPTARATGGDRSLSLLQGSGGGVRSEMSWFVAPLPPSGTIEFSCSWPALGMNFRYELDAGDQIRRAANESNYLLE